MSLATLTVYLLSLGNTPASNYKVVSLSCYTFKRAEVSEEDLSEVRWLQYSLMAFAVQIVHLP